VCGKQAVAFFPVYDPDIPAYPYCRDCLDKAKTELRDKLFDIDNRYHKKRNYGTRRNQD